MSQTARHLGRFRMNDGLFPPSGSRFAATRTRDVAEKMELARFPGHQVVAERDGEDLVIYQIGDPDGLGVNLTNTTDRDRSPPPQTTADLQKLYDRAYERRDNFKQRADRHSATQVLADHVRR
jgi:hypothetical protein